MPDQAARNRGIAQKQVGMRRRSVRKWGRRLRPGDIRKPSGEFRPPSRMERDRALKTGNFIPSVKLDASRVQDLRAGQNLPPQVVVIRHLESGLRVAGQLLGGKLPMSHEQMKQRQRERLISYPPPGPSKTIARRPTPKVTRTMAQRALTKDRLR